MVPSALTLKDVGMSPEDLFQQRYQRSFKTDTPEEHTVSSPVLPGVHSIARHQASLGKAGAAPPALLLLFHNCCLNVGAGTKPQTPHLA